MTNQNRDRSRKLKSVSTGTKDSMTARTQHMDPQTLTVTGSAASGKPASEAGQRGDTLVTLASGRVVRVRHGQDFATLIRHSA
jgi:hypothetical protein